MDEKEHDSPSPAAAPEAPPADRGAAAEARAAILSGRVVPSNWWRAAEVVGGVLDSGAPEGVDLSELAHEYRPAITSS